MDERQKNFEIWMSVELVTVYSSILSAAFYILIRTFKVPPVVLKPKIVSRVSMDFMETSQMMVEMMTLVFTPAFIGTIDTITPFPIRTIESDGLDKLVIILSYAQLTLMVVGFFATQANINHSTLYNELMPGIVWYSLTVAMFVMPWVVSIFAISKMIRDDVQLPFMFFVCMVELGFFIWCLLTFRVVNTATYNFYSDNRVGIEVLRKRVQAMDQDTEPGDNGDDNYVRPKPRSLEDLKTADDFRRVEQPLEGESDVEKELAAEAFESWT